jgi:uncharacterized protein
MQPRETYPNGVPCFVDTERQDVDAAKAFYGELLGWSFEDMTPPGMSGRFLAKVDGLDVAAVGSAAGPASAPDWNTYIAVDSVEQTVGKAKAAGGEVLVAPVAFGPAGRMAELTDREGARFRVWEAGELSGAQLVNAPGAWNWSNLQTADLESATAFYGAVFGWEFGDVDLGRGASAMVRVPGYGDHLDELNPGTQAAHKAMGAPEGFSDAIGWFEPAQGAPRWAVTFSVADTDATAAKVRALRGRVLLEPMDVPFVRTAVLEDPDGVSLTVGTFKSPER